jgi:capsular polysaccharide biosynthesis protein
MPDTDRPVVVEPAGSGVLVGIRSPGFETVPPDFTQPELIPDSVRQACLAWEQRRFAPREVTIRVARDVFVAAEGLVFDREGQVLRASIHQHEPEMIAAAADAVGRAAMGEAVPTYDLPLVLGKKRGAGNYGHWMVEMLPMLHLALSRLADPRIGVLVHDVNDPALGHVMQATLRRLGVEDRRVRVSGLAPVFVRTLITVEGLTDHGTYMSPLVRECHDRLAYGIDGSGIERVFLLRGAGASRTFSDEPRMVRLAAEQGFAAVAPAELGLDGQIALMRDARVVAGVMGAAMTNLIYAREGTRAALFAPAGMPDTFFWFIANLRGLSYREIRCTQDGPGGHWNGRLDLDPGLFGKILEQEIAALR